MAEERESEENPVVETAGAEKTFWEKRGFKSEEEFSKEFDLQKTDIAKLRGKKTGAEKKLEEYEQAEEQRRVEALSESEKLKEDFTNQQTENERLQKELLKRDRTALQDKTIFKHSSGKAMLSTRSKLYDKASKSGEWKTAEELTAILDIVDTEFEDDLKALNITLPAAGD
ncbi:MAG: hypothetical protein KAU20_03545, partial [Nanoarchaeota archaeon]|nr:hypothetical protein [Nanoarchaeota archaeon]